MSLFLEPVEISFSKKDGRIRRGEFSSNEYSKSECRLIMLSFHRISLVFQVAIKLCVRFFFSRNHSFYQSDARKQI